MKLLNNKRGYMELILFIPLLLMAVLLLIISFSTTKSSEDGYKNLDLYADRVIEIIEEDGYITDEVKFDIERFAEENSFRYTEISGTENKVEPGEKVQIKIEVYNKNLRGGTLTHYKIFKEGISK